MRRRRTPLGLTPLRPRPEFDRLFDALADAERLHLLEQLELFPSHAGKLALKLGWTRDETAKQLKLLERAGLLQAERVGRRVEYARTPSVLIPALAWTSDLWVCLGQVALKDADILTPDRQVALAAALRTPGRRDMLECMCRGGPITQGAAARNCGLAQGHVSQGLAQLREVGLVRVRTPEPPIRYAGSPETLAALVGWLHSTVEVAKTAKAQQLRFQEARTVQAATRAARG